MISEIDLLKEDLPRLKMRFGVDDPFVEVLKAQLDEAAIAEKSPGTD
jgi:hypothetical protein